MNDDDARDNTFRRAFTWFVDTFIMTNNPVLFFGSAAAAGVFVVTVAGLVTRVLS